MQAGCDPVSLTRGDGDQPDNDCDIDNRCRVDDTSRPVRTRWRVEQSALLRYGWRGGAGVGTIVAGSGQFPSKGGQFGTASSGAG